MTAHKRRHTTQPFALCKLSYATFKGMFDFLEWENSGILNAAACSTAADLENTEYPKMAYEMGKSL